MKEQTESVKVLDTYINQRTAIDPNHFDRQSYEDFSRDPL